MSAFHPELRLARYFPRFSFGPRVVQAMRTAFRYLPPPRPSDGVITEDIRVPGPPAGPPVRVRLYRPSHRPHPAPALLWMHGGGYLIGRPEQDEQSSADYAQTLGILVAAVDYRLAPEQPFPAPLEDCYAALRWLHAQARPLGIDPARIAIGGASAGGGLTACLAQLAHDRGEVMPALQLLIYPMLDDRTTLRRDIDDSHLRLWSPDSNRHGWQAYLAQTPGGPELPAYAAAARRPDLAGLPPAWLGVGTLDLFHDEGVAYAERLAASGVACELQVVPGAFHGFDVMFSRTRVAQEFRKGQLAALRRALFP